MIQKRSYSILTILKWIISIAAYAFLAFKLITFSNYAELKYQFSNISSNTFLWLLAALSLLPLNILAESIKWKMLIRPIQSVSLKEAIKMVLWGNAGAFFTPNRIGEFPTRAMLLPQGTRTSAVSLGFVGSLAQTIVISTCGIIALNYFIPFCIEHYAEQTHIDLNRYIIPYIIVTIFLFALFISIPLWIKVLNKINNRHIKNIAAVCQQLNPTHLLQILFIAALRYGIFSLQSFCMYRFCLVNFSFETALIAIPTFFLFVTFTPSINVSEMAVRSTYATFIISCFSSNLIGIILASSLTWAINYCLPMLLGSLFVKFNNSNN